jgi:predicted esterase
MTRSRTALGVSLVALACVAGVIAFRWKGSAPAPETLTVEALDAGLEAWCASDLTPIAGGGCFAAPANVAAPVPLLVYLHGRYDPKMIPEELERQNRLARRGTAKGFAVLALHGVQGECTQPELADYWCWPSNPRNADHGSAFVGRFGPAMTEARRRVGQGPNVLLGFSNGAYFATLIATRALAPFDAIAIAHGGPVPPTHAAGAKTSVLLITADDDPSDPEMRQLDAELTQEKWPHDLVAREGVHALLDWDVDIALAFFARARKESVPLAPPLQPLHVRRPDSGAEQALAPPPEPAAAAPDNPYEADDTK